MYCEKCGKPLKSNSKFCFHCGTEISTEYMELTASTLPHATLGKKNSFYLLSILYYFGTLLLSIILYLITSHFAISAVGEAAFYAWNGLSILNLLVLTSLLGYAYLVSKFATFSTRKYLLLVMFGALILSVILYLCLPSIGVFLLNFFPGATGSFPISMNYLLSSGRWWCISLPLVALGIGLKSLLLTVDVRKFCIIEAIHFAISFLLTYVFIFVFLFGITGAAFALIAAELVRIGISGLVYYKKKGNTVQRLHKPTSPKFLRRVLAITLAAIIAISLSFVVVSILKPFDIQGSWISTGDRGWGQAQPGAVIAFDGTNCNLYSPMDTYALSREGKTYQLFVTSLLGETIKFNVQILSNKEIKVIYGNTLIELRRTE